MRVAITGASGFLGRYLGQYLEHRGKQAIGLLRQPETGFPYAHRVTGSAADEEGYAKAFSDCDSVVHLAAQAHVRPGNSADEHRRIIESNVELVETVLRAALSAKVKKFVFISSVKVYGEMTITEPVRTDTLHRPLDIYAQSKHEAEQRVLALTRNTEMKPTIIQSPLIYGHGVKGNLQSLLKAMRMGLPLPFAAIDNRRDIVALPVISDLIDTCLDNERSAYQTFLVADGQARSTAEIIRLLGRIHGVKAKLFAVPTPLLKTLFAIPGLAAPGTRLLDDLQVDISDTSRQLDWQPSIPDPATMGNGYR